MFYLLVKPRVFQHNRFCMLKTSVTKWQATSEKPNPTKPNELGVGVDTEEPNPAPRVITAPSIGPIVGQKKAGGICLPFDEVPGPRALKYMSTVRHYLSEVGTQLTAGTLTFFLNIGSILRSRRPHALSSSLFDEYGPVVRFVSPIGGDIVLINKPSHIEKVFAMEGKFPVRSTFDSLDKYRKEIRSNIYRGTFTSQGEEWCRQRNALEQPLNNALNDHMQNIYDISEAFTQKIYNLRNHQDVVPNDLYKQLNKWTFDCLSLVLLSKKVNTMADTEAIYSRCDMSWLHESLESAAKVILKCESGMHMWKLFPTPAWYSLVKHCDNVDNIIGKHVLEVEQYLSNKNTAVNTTVELSPSTETKADDLICVMLQAGFSPEDITTIVMDMMIMGVECVSTSISFLLYHLAKHQKCQKILYEEIEKIPNEPMQDDRCLKEFTPYLQACIKENHRLVPPIPLITRVLPRNITLDKYNIPRGTMIIISTRDASLKESNYEDACKFSPDRWLNNADDHPLFASIPFGFGARKCLGQNLTETMLIVLTVKILKKYHLEYHYGDIQPTKTFVTKPNRPLKIRFTDRY